MQANQTESANFSASSEFETPVAVEESLMTSVSLLSASADTPREDPREERPDWSFIAEEDSSFFVPERCTALDDF